MTLPSYACAQNTNMKKKKNPRGETRLGGKWDMASRLAHDPFRAENPRKRWAGSPKCDCNTPERTVAWAKRLRCIVLNRGCAAEREPDWRLRSIRRRHAGGDTTEASRSLTRRYYRISHVSRSQDLLEFPTLSLLCVNQLNLNECVCVCVLAHRRSLPFLSRPRPVCCISSFSPCCDFPAGQGSSLSLMIAL